MGLVVVRLDCNGGKVDTVADPDNFLHRLLPPMDEDSDNLLAKVDWYGDTYFNYLQMKKFISEWDRLAQRAQSLHEGEMITRVRALAVRCHIDRGLLRFIGD